MIQEDAVREALAQHDEAIASVHEYDVLAAAAREWLDMKVEWAVVQEKTWGPGDTYLEASGGQVFPEHGFRRGQKVYRRVSKWKVEETCWVSEGEVPTDA